jgi:mannose-6-phosphate isomerase-like protein (cupin superfamily)
MDKGDKIMTEIIDNGPAPTVANIETATLENTNYRTTLWTGKNLQLTLMSIEPGHDIGLEVHDTHDQFLRIEQGLATVSMGPSKDQLQTWQASASDAVFVPAGMWHNLECADGVVLKVYSIYAPPQHPHGTVHATQADGEAAEHAPVTQQ